MALKDVVKVSRKTFFNPRGWLGYDMLALQFKTSWRILKNLFTPATPQRTETFEEAMIRMNLTEDDIKTTSYRYLIFSGLFVVLGIIATGISFYFLIHHGAISGWILGLVSATLLFTYAFRYHFWHFQIKHRKLGCTFDEWWQGKINDQERQAP
ncbi:MAG: type IVB secretion system protein IcmV [Gammaproteobacteria bacterium]